MNRGRTRRYSDYELVAELDRFLRWVRGGERVYAFLASEGITASELDNHKNAAVSRGLFERGGKKGRAGGGWLTEKGERVLAEGRAEE
jgi:hypothetical protein